LLFKARAFSAFLFGPVAIFKILQTLKIRGLAKGRFLAPGMALLQRHGAKELLKQPVGEMNQERINRNRIAV